MRELRGMVGGVLAGVMLVVPAGCTYITRASQAGTGGSPNCQSYQPALSGDGRYAVFESCASDIIAPDRNEARDVFRRDLRTGTNVRVSVAPDGGDTFVGPGPGDNDSASGRAAINADGRYVVFRSWAYNVVAGDTNDTSDVFRRDLVTGVTALVSIDSAGGPANGASDYPTISADGRYVAFVSGADDLVAGDGNGVNDVFVRDLQSGTTTRVSVSPTGGDVHRWSGPPSISANGRFVAFESPAADVVSGDLNGSTDVFVRDLVTGTTSRASVDGSGGDADAPSESLSQALSADGRFVVFSSQATDLVSGDTNGFGDIFVRDRLTGTTSRVSVDTAGGDPNSLSMGEAISGDGRYVSFQSGASDLIAHDTNGTGGYDVFVRDRVTATTTRATEDAFGREVSECNPYATHTALSADGRYVAFDCDSQPLVSDDADSFSDVFVRATVEPTITSVTPASAARGTSTLLTVTGTGFRPGTTVTAVPADVTVTGVMIVSENKLTVSVTIAANAATGNRTLYVTPPGTGPGTSATSFAACQCVAVT